MDHNLYREAAVGQRVESLRRSAGRRHRAAAPAAHEPRIRGLLTAMHLRRPVPAAVAASC